MANDAKKQLVDLVVDRALDPVMRADPRGRSETDKGKLADVQRATEAEIKRYRDYDSAREVVVNFRRDLSSDAAKKIHRELRDLNLPTLHDIRDEFEDKASELGVG